MNEYAARVAPLVAEAFPEHANKIEVDGDGDLILRIDCPFATDGAGLYINTWNEQTEVSFHYGRAEYSDWDGTGADDHVREAMEVARDVLAERLVAISWYSRKGYAAAMLTTPEEATSELRRSQDDIARRFQQPIRAWIRRKLGWPSSGNLPARLGDDLYRGEVVVRSWRGSYDGTSESRA